MRDIAKAADMSIGAAYYYFPSKEAIVSGYYESLIEVHKERVRALQMGVLLFFLHDTSPELARTRRLIDRALDAAGQVMLFASLPVSAPIIAPIVSLLREAGLLPEPGSPPVEKQNK